MSTELRITAMRELENCDCDRSMPHPSTVFRKPKQSWTLFQTWDCHFHLTSHSTSFQPHYSQSRDRTSTVWQVKTCLGKCTRDGSWEEGGGNIDEARRGSNFAIILKNHCSFGSLCYARNILFLYQRTLICTFTRQVCFTTSYSFEIDRLYDYFPSVRERRLGCNGSSVH